MQVEKFLKTIRKHEDLPMLFELRPGTVVPGGYHVTEIKNAGYETIDCGNSLHTWKEVVVQVWVPEEATPEDEWMPTGKFTKIWDVVDGRLSLHQDAEIRIEYGDAENITSIYHVDNVTVTEDGLVVQMAPPRTMCKPREILIPLNNAIEAVMGQSSCCAPAPVSSRIEAVIPLPVKKAVKAATSCCTPASESNCC